MDIDIVAEELYSLPPGEFTAARNVREKEAKAVGDKQLAAAIHQLRKPSTGAWLANQLVREYADEVQSFLDLGAALREATAKFSGDQLRELGKQRRQVVYALMQQARGLANAAGHKVSQDTVRTLEDTLHAALADDGAASQLKTGRLTDTLQGAGFPPTASTRSANSVPDSTSLYSGTKDSSEPQRADQLGRAKRDEQLARAAVRECADDHDQAGAALDRAETALQQITGRVTGLRVDLGKAEIEQAGREQEHRKSQAALDRANRAAREAARQLDEAIQRRERLSSSEPERR